MAAPYVRPADRVLDIGCGDGAFIESVRARVSRAVGIDPVASPSENGNVTILRGAVPGDPRLESERFACITMLATLEHVADPSAVGRECFRLLEPGGRLVVTVPHRLVDRILPALVSVGVADGMGLDPHLGFDSRTTEPMLVHAGFRLTAKHFFELGLNCLYVFEKPLAPA